MFANKATGDYTWKTAFDWFLLAFLAGTVNAGGFMACHRFVTHVTGFATLFGLALVDGNGLEAVGMISVPAFFLIGVIVAAWLVDRPLHRGEVPHYTIAMALIAACLATAGLLGEKMFFGPFGGASDMSSDYFLMVLLCTASGLQNAAISTSSGSTIRLTHLTGLTTDLGTGLVRAFTIRKHRRAFYRELRAALLRTGTIFAFGLGGVVGAILFKSVGYLGFLVPAGIAVYAMLVANRDRPRRQRAKSDELEHREG